MRKIIGMVLLTSPITVACAGLIYSGGWAGAAVIGAVFLLLACAALGSYLLRD